MTVTPIHRDHDELLIVRAAEGDDDPVDALVARKQLGACTECRALFADIAAIRASTTAAVLRVPPRPRSFRLDPDVLAWQHLPIWRRWLSRLGSSRYDVLRPLAGTVAGIGLAVMVLSSVTLSFGSPAAAPLRDLAGAPAASQGSSEVYAAPSTPPAPGATTPGDRSTAYGPSAGGASGPTGSPPSLVSGGSGSSAYGSSGAPGTAAPEVPAAGQGKSVDSGSQSPPSARPTPSAPSTALPLGVVGAVLLLAGLGVFFLQTTARRMARR